MQQERLSTQKKANLFSLLGENNTKAIQIFWTWADSLSPPALKSPLGWPCSLGGDLALGREAQPPVLAKATEKPTLVP